MTMRRLGRLSWAFQDADPWKHRVMAAESDGVGPRSTHAQTLSRGLTALELLADAPEPMTIAQLAGALGVHRSIAYRLLRTLEEHGLVIRDDAGRAKLGPRVATLARGVSRDLQRAALPELTALANELGLTVFISVLDRDEAITLASVEPRAVSKVIRRSAGARHPIHRGAPGLAMQLQLSATEVDVLRSRGLAFSPAALTRASADGYAVSHGEVVPGLSSIAVPLELRGQAPAALAVLRVASPADPDYLARRLRAAAHAIAAELR